MESEGYRFFFRQRFQAVLDLAYKQTAFISTFFIGVVICALFRVFFSIFSRKDTNNWWVHCGILFLRLIFVRKKKKHESIHNVPSKENNTKKK